jgi:repressor LexA
VGVLTGKQQRVLDFIRDFTAENGYPPSVREICRALGLKSPSSVHAHIKKLEQQGLILKGGSSARAIILNTPDKIGSGVKNIPVLGKVAAGEPILAVEDILGFIPFDTGNSGFEYFGLRVRGDSMINAGIFENDVLIVEKRSTAENRDIVVAIIEGEATVKRLRLDGTHVWLQPENPMYEPIDGTNAEIIGKVVAGIRYF